MTDVSRRGLFQWASVAASALGLLLFSKRVEAIDVPAVSPVDGPPARIPCPEGWAVTRWKPDTCGCVLDYGWQRGTSGEERIHVPLPPVKVCAQHQHEADPFLAALFQNRRKNGMDESLLAKDIDTRPDPTVVLALARTRDAADRVARFETWLAEQRKIRDDQWAADMARRFTDGDLT